MWYPPKVTTQPAEWITTAEAKRHLNVFHDDDNGLIDALVAAARDHVENYTSTRLAEQTLEIKCDGFADFFYVPLAPLRSVTSIEYVDTTGAAQTLANAVYEERFDGLHSAIVLKSGQQWPSIQSGSRVKLAVVAGYVVLPPSIRHAMLLWLSDAYEQRENAAMPQWSAFDALLSNHRRA